MEVGWRPQMEWSGKDAPWEAEEPRWECLAGVTGKVLSRGQEDPDALTHTAPTHTSFC